VFMNMHMIFIKLEAHLVKKIVLPIVTYVNWWSICTWTQHTIVKKCIVQNTIPFPSLKMLFNFFCITAFSNFYTTEACTPYILWSTFLQSSICISQTWFM
jgi:hypothetical protein